MKKIKIIVHCSDSTFGDAKLINKWHVERGFKMIGYHYVVLNGQISSKIFDDHLDGSVQVGRPLDDDDIIEPNEVGAHTLGFNSTSVGICLIGKDKFSVSQLNSLIVLCFMLKERFKLTAQDIIGHYEVDKTGKTCPNINMEHFRGLLKAYELVVNKSCKYTFNGGKK